ncbi:hypothetical protein J4233_01535 [Candidatus Pacearchaeota archaeon]|nr:hypothetical protein [Candidatus Pacearchaeota archaeon]
MTTPRELYNRGAIRIVKNPQAVPVYDVHIGRECFQIPADKFYEAADASDEEVRKIFGLEGLYRGRMIAAVTEGALSIGTLHLAFSQAQNAEAQTRIKELEAELSYQRNAPLKD